MTQSLLLPPLSVQGMTSLDRSKFTKEISVPILKVPAFLMHGIMSALSGYILKLDKFRPIQDSEKGEKIIFLNPDLVRSFDSLERGTRMCLEEMEINSSDFEFRNINLTYDNWKVHEIISAVLPPPLSFSGYSIIGSVIHVNLKNELLPYKLIIGEVLRDKIKNVKSVVNKTKMIDNTYRNFEMEILSGSNELKTETKENGCRFEMDFSQVYWNPRLHEEHCRIINLVSEGDVFYDVFCGIGPFALPIAKKRCHVLANDLNPACFQWLNRNIEINKVSRWVTSFNKPGEAFIKEDFKEDYLKRINDPMYVDSKFYITMNLPSTAYMFLSAFVNLFTSDELSTVKQNSLPIVYLYCFINGKQDIMREIRQLVAPVLSSSIANQIQEDDVHNVRNVAPSKEMYRVKLSLSKEILTGGELDEVDDFHSAKRIRLSSMVVDNKSSAKLME